MQTLSMEQDKKVFGFQVKTFPEKISQAFDELMQKIPDGNQRSLYGISWIEGGKIIYFAAAEQLVENESTRYGATEFTLKNGTYLVETLVDWMPKTKLIKGIFENMMKHPELDKSSPAIEWYKSDDEMCCMMRLV